MNNGGQQPGTVRVALLGQPNAGKTAIFNQLTHSLAHVANYPGVTVERREANYQFEGRRYQVLDLPGTYSLSSFSPEERITEEQLLDAPPAVLVVVVDSMTLSRSLMLLGQALLLRPQVVLCLNMADEARRAGLRLDREGMERLLGLPVVETVGHRGEGIEELRRAIARAAADRKPPRAPVLGEQLGDALATLSPFLERAGVPAGPRDFYALRLLAGDQWLSERLGGGPPAKDAGREAERLRRALEVGAGMDMALFISQQLSGFVEGLLKEVTLRRARPDARAVSDRLDVILADRRLGLWVFALVMYGVFWLTFTVGELPVSWLEKGFAWLAGWVGGWWPNGSDSLLRSLLVDGIIGGVGGVLVFLPNILLLFLGLAFLEDTGYMARAAHLVDHLMHRFGLHGKSFLPMLVGFGCNIPGIMAARTLENRSDRLITILVLPLMSCGARLTIWMLLVPAFFPPAWQAPVLWSIYALGIVLALLLARLLRRTLFAGHEAPFVMELPPYRLPTGRALLAKMVDRSMLYLRKAGTVILGISLVMWLITSFPRPPQAPAVGESPAPASADAVLHYSLAGRLGRALEPLLAPLGLDWKVGVALVGAFTAKEVFVAQLGIVYALAGGEPASLREELHRDYTPMQGVSLIVFMLVAMPCMATVAVTRREAGGWKWALLQLGGLTALGYGLALLVYQLGRFLG